MTHRQPSDAGSSAGTAALVPERRGTLPPPEWGERDGPRSAASIALEWRDADRPLARRTGPRAELEFLRAQLGRAAAAEERDGERQAAVALARALAARGVELDTATRLARRALLLGDDASLREELAGWFAGLGELPLAAAALRPIAETLPPERAARILTRVAVHLGRAGDAAGVVDALMHAAELDPTNPVPLELAGAVASWAPRSVGLDRAAQAYLDGADRREALGEGPAAFEDLLRAYEVSPAHVKAAERLAGTLSQRGRLGAADEVLREHAAASPDHARAVHLWRMADAAARGDLPRALGAALDAGLDGEPDPYSALRALQLEPPEADGTLGFDELIERLGLFDLLAARLELAVESAPEALRGRCLVGLARLLEGPLATPERALELWVEALAVDPGCAEALERIRDQAGTLRDQTVLVEAVLRVGGTPLERWSTERSTCLAELAVLAEQRLADPALALWGLERLAAAGATTPELAAVGARAAVRLATHAEALAQVETVLGTTGAAQRPSALRRAAALLRARPERLEAYVAVLDELVATAPSERVWQAMLERALLRAGDEAGLEGAYLRLLERAPPPLERQRASLALAAIARRRDDPRAALERVAALVVEGGPLGAANGVALLIAARLGDARARAQALLALAGRLAPSLRAVLSAVAADLYLGAGELPAARAAAEQGHASDPSLARPIATLARVAVAVREPDLAATLERAMGVIVPRADHCQALARALDQAGERELALAWTQRWLALRPGDPAAAASLLAQATRHGDVPRLGDALGWLFAQPQPIGELLEPVCAALVTLSDLAPQRTGALARRALDVLGPRESLLRETVLKVADAVGEPGLAIVTIERWLAAGMRGESRSATLLELAHRRRQVGDADGAARSLLRALGEGADAAVLLDEVESALPPRSADGELALLEVRAEALSALSGADPLGAAQAWRDLGASRWDLAGDPAGAVRAWHRALVLDPESGVELFAHDLVTFGGVDVALARLSELAETRGEAAMAARVLSVASAVALHGGQHDAAVDLALQALELHPGEAEALAVAERAASTERLDDLERAYNLIAAASLGCYGERAIHYRAARQLERRDAVVPAFAHAVAAFEAVPAQGVTFVLMARLAERTGEHAEMIRAIERVASATVSAAVRAEWMQRAASYAGHGPEGRRQRVEVLFRALALRPDTATVRYLVAAAVDAIAGEAEDRDTLAMRYARAVRELLGDLGGPDGGRIALELALGSFAVGGDLALVGEALLRALDCDADIDEYRSLMPHAATLAAEPTLATAFVERVEALGAAQWSNLGRAALELAVEVAERAGDRAHAARLLLAAAAREPEDAGLAARASGAVTALGDPMAIARAMDAVPVARRVSALLELARSATERSDAGAAMEALELVLTAPSLAAAERDGVVDQLAELYATSGRREPLLALLGSELEREELETARRIALTRRRAASLAASGRGAEGLELLIEVRSRHPDDPDVLADAVVLARQVGDRRVAADALDRLVDRAGSASERIALLRELAPLLEQLGDPRAAERWTHLAEADPTALDALAALERQAERTGDFDALAQLLGRRAALTTEVDELRRVRLRRATVLEQRLARHDEARAELEELLATTGDHLSVLRVLADLHQRLGDELRAAPLWLRASAVARDRDEAAGLAQRACAAFLRGNDATGARRVLDGMEAWAPRPLLAALRVEVERRGENPLALARALAEHAGLSQDSAEKRASLLVEAARLAEAAGEAAMALGDAQKAARLAPSAAAPQLIARLLEYRKRGVGTSEEARVTVAELRAIESGLTPAQVELRAFLVAEALDVAVGLAAGLRELERARAEVGERPLVALGLAERAAGSGEPGQAVPLFERALAGDLRGLRVRGEVALAAAMAARRVGAPEQALALVELALAEPVTRGRALELREIMVQEVSPPPRGASDPTAAPAPQAAPAAGETRGEVAPSPPPVPARRPAAVFSEEPFPLTRRSEASLRPGAVLPSRAKPMAPAEPPPTVASASHAVAEPVRAVLPTAFDRDSLEVPRAPGSEPPRDTVTEFPPPPPRAASLAPTPSEPPATPPMHASRIVRSSVPPPAPVGTPAVFAARRPAPAQAPPAGSPSATARVGSAGAPREVAATLLSANLPTAAEVLAGLGAPPSAATPDARSSPVNLGQTQRIEPPSSARSAPPPLAQTMRLAEPPAPVSAPAAPAAPAGAASTRDELELARQLDQGSLAAGLSLARQWEGQRERARELVVACRKLALLAPGDPGLLARLHAAIVSDGNPVYAAAIDHLRCAMVDVAAPPPPLLGQPEQPERVRLMLFREGGRVQEALTLVWEGASHVFKREPSAYGVTGVERVPFWAPSPVARIYGAAARTLGINAPLFQRRVPGEITISVALLQTPSVIVNGELPRPSPEFAFHLGVMLAAAMPAHALLCGAPEDQARSVLRALLMAFGPPNASRSGLTAVANLAEVLWESMPTRSQRRLRQLCDDPLGLVYEGAMADVRAATRRAGLFVAGDFRVAAREVAFELNLSLDRGLAAACAASPELFDLFRLATSPEYAEARWQPSRGVSRPPEGTFQV